ncbi:MAG: histidine kinase dimerization/phospho-acceptor domain-containing protein [Pseudomonadota bacterium]
MHRERLRLAAEKKWRPSLALIVAAVLGAVLVLPAAALLAILTGSPLTGADLPAAATGLPDFAGPVAIVVSVGLLGAAVIGFVFVRAITRPIEILTRRVRRLAGGDRSALMPLERYGSREISTLADASLGMADALFQRSDYVRTLAAHLTHEVKTPLTSIRGAVELMVDDDGTMTDAERSRFLSQISDDTDRLGQIVDGLRQLATADAGADGGACALDAAVAAAAARESNLVVKCCGVLPKVAMSEENAAIVFAHLFENARGVGAQIVQVDAAGPVGDVDETGFVDIVVSDDGPGVDHAHAARVFDLFYTTRRDAGGTGMGLGIVRAMMASHGGSIALRDARAERAGADALAGAVFMLRYPRA